MSKRRPGKGTSSKKADRPSVTVKFTALNKVLESYDAKLTKIARKIESTKLTRILNAIHALQLQSECQTQQTIPFP